MAYYVETMSCHIKAQDLKSVDWLQTATPGASVRWFWTKPKIPMVLKHLHSNETLALIVGLIWKT